MLKILLKDKRFVGLLIIAVLLCSMMGVSLAYFVADVMGNNLANSSNIKTVGNISLLLQDGDEVNGSNWVPGNKVTKTFKVKNTGDVNTRYTVYLSDVINNFVRPADLVYEIKSDSEGAYKTSTKLQVPIESKAIIDSIEIEPGATHEYELDIEFLYQDRVQDENMGKKFSGKIQLEDYHYSPHLIDFVIDENEKISKGYIVGQPFGEFPRVSKDGLSLRGWYLDEEKTRPVARDTIVTNEMTTLYGDFSEEKYTLTVDDGNNTRTYSLKPGETKNIADPTKTGHTFQNWTLSGEGSTFVNNTFTMGSENATLTAEYDVNKYNLTIVSTCPAGDFRSETVEVEYGSEYYISEIYCDEYELGGWEDGYKGVFEDTTTYVMPASDDTIVAQYYRSSGFQTYYFCIEDYDTGEYNCEEGQEPYYCDDYLYCDVAYDDTYRYEYASRYEVVGDDIYYYFPLRTFHVHINPAGNYYDDIIPEFLEYEGEEYYDIKYGQYIDVPLPTYPGGYVYYDEYSGAVGFNGTQMYVQYYASDSTDVEVNPYWSFSNTILNYNLNGATDYYEPIEIDYVGEIHDLPTPTRTGFTFDGWYTYYDSYDENGDYETDIKIEEGHRYFEYFDETYDGSNNIEIRMAAKWNPIKYNLKVYSNDGTDRLFELDDVYFNESVNLSEIFTREGYKIKGFSTSSDGSSYSILDDLVFGLSTKEGDTVTLYTIWDEEANVDENYKINCNGSLEECLTKNANENSPYLFYDNTADNNIRYRGANPNNYVVINNSTWRIIGLFNNMQTESGETKSLVKLQSYYAYVTTPWTRYKWTNTTINNGGGINQWGPSTYEEGGSYEGSTLMNALNSSSGNYLQNYMEKVVWKFGAVSQDFNNMTASEIYSAERSNELTKQCKKSSNCKDTVIRTSEWTGYIAPPYASDFLYATGGGNLDYENEHYESTADECLLLTSKNFSNNVACSHRSWEMIYVGDKSYTFSPIKESATAVIKIGRFGLEYTSTDDPPNNWSIRSAYSFYLKSNYKVVDGDGSENNPYRLESF